MISIRNLAVTYRHGSTEVKALDGLSLNIPEGEIFAVTGPSGCGKSTFLHVLAGVLTEYEGEVLFDGKPLNPKSFSIGIVPQQYGLLPWKRVRENIVLPYTLRKEAIEMPEFESIVRILGLSDILHRYPRELSGGQRQRVALARVFLQRPQLLLLDEAFAALDMLTAEKSRQLFLGLWDKHRVTTVMVTHNVEEAVAMSSRVAVIGGMPGRIRGLCEHPDTDTIRRMLNRIEV
ncbi:ABC transporter ATP-binding protein [Porphyromonas gulae]|uniref:ABC transporter ATP-binding protein n=1 Tax=Porphyromonas gulae TaxID=111105 RepID=UPI00052C67E5|nr:ABC transporter ATP-binding protein [Porphyromonas gulae]KGN73759.1 ABC transporter ATP-binding protein [Porphyromonas gulae]KGN73962.1 ABC transporter ATP-binding protein [Porphyromonas gulae]KGN88215.1 ABC transporter ATP-binding protein [Porphyromonas gulae]KGO03220.1 ABC transporter ATP-binding protein [Porphyromonas gulae]KGO04989.1 ABC transporter ATP-binding protein [Porphyromonas gulae]